MDREKVEGYKFRIQSVFRWSKDHGGFVDRRHIGDLRNGIANLMRTARSELSRPKDRWELLAVSNAVFQEWSETQMDDDGDTAVIMEEVSAAWDEAVTRLVDEAEQAQALEVFMEQCGQSAGEYMEDYLHHFMDTHFKTAPLLAMKRSFWESNLQGEQTPDGNQPQRDIRTAAYQDYLLQVLADEGASLREIEQYAAEHYSSRTNQRILNIYAARGETVRETAMLCELITAERQSKVKSYAYTGYEKRLKDIYFHSGKAMEYRKLLRQMFYENPGDGGLYDEYRRLFTDEKWKEETEMHLFPALAGKRCAMPLFAKEKRYDLLMDAAEKLDNLFGYEKLLKREYPEKCFNILIRNADRELESARERVGYRRVADIIRLIKTYPGGREIAAKLVRRYMQEHPTKRALWDELARI